MNRLVKLSVISLLVLLVIVIAAFVVVINVNQSESEAEPTIDDIVEYSYQTPEITTNLDDGHFVRIQFQVVTDSSETKEELSKREFQIKNILIKELATMEEEDFQTGLADLEKKLVTKINEVVTNGEITDVYTIDKVLQ